ncbi:MAG: hypothetical protein ACOCWO_06230 [Candidatus Muiribacteriaceae bacterium]
MTDRSFFSFSFSQKKILEKYCFILDKNPDSLIQDFIADCSSLNPSNVKANTEKFMDHVFSLVYPEYSSALSMLNSIKEKYSGKKIAIRADSTFEDPEIELTVKFSTPDELDHLLRSLKALQKDHEYLFRNIYEKNTD